MQYAKMTSCSVPVIIACICFIACGRKVAAIDEKTIAIEAIPCGKSYIKPQTDSIFSNEQVKPVAQNRSSKK